MIELSKSIGGKELYIQTGFLAKQANSSVRVRYGGTEVLATVVFSEKKEEPIDFVPLTVDYRERTYAAGRIPGGFFKREGRPTEAEILISRLIDRTIRPLFPDGLQNEIQIMVTVLSSDQENSTDFPSIIAAGIALLISGFKGILPVAGVKIGYVDGNFVLNPTISQLENSKLDLVISGTKDSILMLEGKSDEISEDKFIDAIAFAHKHIKEIISFEEEFLNMVHFKKEFIPSIIEIPEDFSRKIENFVSGDIEKIFDLPDKIERKKFLKKLYDKTKDSFKVEEKKDEVILNFVFSKILKSIVRKKILEENKRIDGRKPDEIRVIDCKVGVLPRTHGSAIFTRGETQALVTVTLGTAQDMQVMDELEGVYKKRFMLHYNFPPFATGEIKSLRGPSRREIGHGHLAEMALYSVLPGQEEFPYTIRVVSDILESNGSSSMASVCGATLSLMDAGVPIREMVSGVAMGLVKEGEREVILTDILGDEDHIGDMDLKIAGTENGITAIQMDLKIEGLDFETLKNAFQKAREARLEILKIMKETISSPRKSVSKFAPKIVSIRVNPNKIGEVIGPGGKTIKKIIEETGAKIEIEEDGVIYISGDEIEKVRDAKNMIEFLTQDIEVGKIYKGKVVKVVSFGAFVEIIPGREGLCHISQISLDRINKVSDVVSEGMKILVKVTDIDHLGRIILSRKEALKELGIRDEREYTSEDIE